MLQRAGSKTGTRTGLHSNSETRRILSPAVLLAVLVTATAVFAQDATQEPSNGPALSADEQVAKAAENLTAMNDMVTRIAARASKAERDGDKTLQNCLNDKLVLLRANINIAENAQTGLQEAVQSGDAAAREYQFGKLEDAFQGAMTANEEAQQCGGQDTAYIGASMVSVEVDPDVAQQGDPTLAPIPGANTGISAPGVTAPGGQEWMSGGGGTTTNPFTNHNPTGSPQE